MTANTLSLIHIFHLYAAHLHPIGKRLDVLQVMKTGARFLCALPLAAIFSFEPRCGLILKGGKPYRIQRFAGRYAVSGRPVSYTHLKAALRVRGEHSLARRGAYTKGFRRKQRLVIVAAQRR